VVLLEEVVVVVVVVDGILEKHVETRRGRSDDGPGRPRFFLLEERR
jgi:hypothetical protein